MKNVIIAFSQIQFFHSVIVFLQDELPKQVFEVSPTSPTTFTDFDTLFSIGLYNLYFLLQCHFNFTMFFKIDTLLDCVGWASDFHSFLQVAQSTGTCQHPCPFLHLTLALASRVHQVHAKTDWSSLRHISSPSLQTSEMTAGCPLFRGGC